MKRIYLNNTPKINFNFTQTPYSFKVKENINIKTQKRANFKLIEVTKKEKSTIELIEYLSEVFKINKKDIGYAGLKDKHATTTQYLTIPKNIKIERFKNSHKIELKELGFVSNPLKIGDLYSNSFTIILEEISKDEYQKATLALNYISKNGFANFFGYQRFGKEDESSIQKGKKISQSGERVKNQRGKILLASYQASFFNKWLNRRLEISKLIQENKKDKFLDTLSPTLYNTIYNTPNIFKLLPGDLGYSLKNGRKNFRNVFDIQKESENFYKKRFYPTGLLFGNSVRLSSSIAKEIEKEFLDINFSALKGTRRVAWVWPKDLKYFYDEKREKLKLIFTLLPGSYATVFLEELAKKELK